MWINLILLFLYASQSDGKKPQFKIGEGYICPKTKHFYMVALVNIPENGSLYFIGGGTLLNQLWVLTAAVHMYNYEDVTKYTVIAGIRSLSEMKSKSKQMQKSSVELVHLSNDLITDALDIALLKLKNPMHESKTVSFVQLATEEANIQGKNLHEICAKATIVGYGNKKNDRPVFSGLYCAQVPVISPQRCSEELPYFTLPHQLACIFQPEIYVCYGDAGGPVMCNGIQYGILSGGYGCDNKIPSIFTRVDKYEYFIKSKLRKDYIAKESKCSLNNFLNVYVLISSVICYRIFNYKFC